MIYTVTFNPAVDYVVHIDRVRIGEINSLNSESVFFGGKGINVSIVLSRLGVSTRALGFAAGFTGAAIEAGVRENGVDTDFVYLKNGLSRINVKIRAAEETDLNAAGPRIGEEDISRLYEKLDGIKAGDTIVLAGSIPPTLPPDIYEKILARFDGKNIRAAVDARGKLLLNTLNYKPFLIKPNSDELGELFGVTVDGIDNIVSYALKLKEMGAVNVLVSMGEQGAVLADRYGRIYRCNACEGKAINTVGAGDSMMAGFLAGSQFSEGDYEYALRLGTAAGGAAAFSEGLGSRDDIMRLLRECVCERIS